MRLHGTGGSLVWDMQRINELLVHYNRARQPLREGDKRLFGSPHFPLHGNFNGGQGTGLGYKDLKTIEVAQFLDSVARSTQAEPGFQEALAVATVHDAIERSWESGSW